MKKFIGLLFLVFVFSSCTETIIDESHSGYEETELMGVSDEHKVKYEDVLKLTQVSNNGGDVTRSSLNQVAMVECLTDNTNDTLLYVSSRQDGGWIMYASDTRVPAVVAQSESGSFDDLKQIDGARLWIQSIMEDMSLIRRLPDGLLNFSREEIAGNRAFWESISSPDQFVRNMLLPKTRIIDDLVPVPTNGYYRFAGSYTYTQVYDFLPRMITTDWKQAHPYNIYCPRRSDRDENAPAGCVAIAGAQMLYFLHKHYGVPTTAPSEAYCNGDITSYTWSQYNYTTTIWDDIAEEDVYATPLIADVGRRVNMEYGNSVSLARTSDLVDNVFAPYGISCTYTGYNVDLLKNSLLDSVPVLLSAFSNNTATGATGRVGHAFIADRYKRTRTVTKNCYEWVYDSIPSDKPIPMVPNMETYTYTSPSISMIGMNWGWGSMYNDESEWFSLTGDWIKSPSSTSTNNWNINRNMIYNFQVINN